MTIEVINFVNLSTAQNETIFLIQSTFFTAIFRSFRGWAEPRNLVINEILNKTAKSGEQLITEQDHEV